MDPYDVFSAFHVLSHYINHAVQYKRQNLKLVETSQPHRLQGTKKWPGTGSDDWSDVS